MPHKVMILNINKVELERLKNSKSVEPKAFALFNSLSNNELSSAGKKIATLKNALNIVAKTLTAKPLQKRFNKGLY